MKVLLVDDDEFLLDMYKLKFASLGHEVVCAQGGGSALKIIAADASLDVVVLDMIMPGMTGTELIAEARRQFPHHKAKFVVLSNQGQEADISEAVAAGANGYIIKAATIPSEVVAKVEEIYQT